MSFFHQRTIRFQDTDAAGVVYFATLLSICHEAYEASLAATGIDLRAFFQSQAIAIPIVHAAIDFRQPLFCGEECTIQVHPTCLSLDKFQIQYEVLLTKSSGQAKFLGQPCAQATTIHVCINPLTRTRTELPPMIHNWLYQSETS